MGYTAVYEKDEDGIWIVRIVEADGVHSNGRTLEQARERVREALSLDIGDDAFTVEIRDDVKLPRAVRASVAQAVRAQGRASVEVDRAEEATRLAVTQLIGAGLSLRDAGKLLGLTRQRIHQIARRGEPGKRAKARSEERGGSASPRRARKAGKGTPS